MIIRWWLKTCVAQVFLVVMFMIERRCLHSFTRQLVLELLVKDFKGQIWKSRPIVPIMVEISLSGRVVPDVYTFSASNTMARRTID
jgi:hypothetical protein